MNKIRILHSCSHYFYWKVKKTREYYAYNSRNRIKYVPYPAKNDIVTELKQRECPPCRAAKYGGSGPILGPTIRSTDLKHLNRQKLLNPESTATEISRIILQAVNEHQRSHFIKIFKQNKNYEILCNGVDIDEIKTR